MRRDLYICDFSARSKIESYRTSCSFLFTVRDGPSFYLPVYMCVCLANASGVMGRAFSAFFALFNQPRQCS